MEVTNERLQSTFRREIAIIPAVARVIAVIALCAGADRPAGAAAALRRTKDVPTHAVRWSLISIVGGAFSPSSF